MKNFEINPHKIICIVGQYIRSRILGSELLINYNLGSDLAEVMLLILLNFKSLASFNL